MYGCQVIRIKPDFELLNYKCCVLPRTKMKGVKIIGFILVQLVKLVVSVMIGWRRGGENKKSLAQ